MRDFRPGVVPRAKPATSVLALVSTCALLLPGCAEPDQTGHVEAALEPPGQHSSPLRPTDVWITVAPDLAELAEREFGAVPHLRSARGGQAAMALRAPEEALPLLSELAHEERGRCGGFVLHDSEADALSALRAPEEGQGALFFRADYALDNAATVEAMMEVLQEPNVLGTIQKLSSFRNRYHTSMTGQEASRWIYDAWRTLAEGRDDVTVELVDHEKTPQPSIAMTLRGTEQPDEFVVLGGHMDSIAGRRPATSLAPGADDNASGVAVLTEVARAALTLRYRPARSVTFYAYAAEEVGLVGSNEIAARAAAEKRDVIGVVQFDMTNFTSAATPYVALTSDFTNAQLNAFTIELVETYLDIPWKYHTCGYGCSDHASWHRHGFPATFPHEANFEEGNQHIHTENDTLALSKNNAQHAMHFARLGVAFMAELAKGKLDTPQAPTCSEASCDDADAGTGSGFVPPPACDEHTPCPAGSACDNGACVPPGASSHDAGVASPPPGATPEHDAGAEGIAPPESAPNPAAPPVVAPRSPAVSGGCSLAPSAPAASRPLAALVLALTCLLFRRRRVGGA